MQELKDDKKFSEAEEDLNINLLDRYQISMVLKRSKFYNSEIFYLGRDCWTLDKSKFKRKRN